MFELLIWAAILIVVAGMVYAYDGSRDVFHPLIFIGPMLIFIYGWMPLKLQIVQGLEGYFQYDQLVFVQALNVLGILAFVLGCISPGCRIGREERIPWSVSRDHARRLLKGGIVLGLLGLAAWTVGIINVGGLRDAFSKPYSGGWDDSGYIRDSSILMFPAFLLILTAALKHLPGALHVLSLGLFAAPWIIQAILTARRGPAFMIMVTIGMGWFLLRNRRPSIIATGLAGLAAGYLILFLVVNRQNIYLGSDLGLTVDVSSIVEKPDTGNEYIYGAGAILSAEQRQRFYWGRRYLAQVVVRPIPRSVWPTKYEDFGVSELTYNGGTGEGFADALGWEGADGSAPGLVADLWLEFRWLSLPVLWLIGRVYAIAWRKAQVEGNVWLAQYVVISALSIYLVMQTIEAVIFRALLLSIPLWIIWGRTRRNEPASTAALYELVSVPQTN